MVFLILNKTEVVLKLFSSIYVFVISTTFHGKIGADFFQLSPHSKSWLKHMHTQVKQLNFSC